MSWSLVILKRGFERRGVQALKRHLNLKARQPATGAEGNQVRRTGVGTKLLPGALCVGGREGIAGVGPSVQSRGGDFEQAIAVAAESIFNFVRVRDDTEADGFREGLGRGS